MAEYIEREAVNNICLKHYNESFDDIPAHEALYAVTDDINKIPSADVVEVVHGEWETKPNAGGYEVCMKCSVCGFQFDNWQHIFKYCPVCGAKMDGERRSENENT